MTTVTTAEESGGFEPGEDGDYLQQPPSKRLRQDAGSENGHGNTQAVVEVPELVEAVEVEESEETDTVTITVPSSQFEIEINSQADEEDGEEIPQIQRTDLSGPNYIVQDPQVKQGFRNCEKLIKMSQLYRKSNS